RPRPPKPARSSLRPTLAPAAASWALIFSASALLAPSLTGLGAPSTRSLASLRPRPVMARTSLITLIFWAPASVRMTSNSVFSSAASAGAAAPAAAATATGAAAETPHFSSSSLESSAASRTVSADRSSTILARSAIFLFLQEVQTVLVSIARVSRGTTSCRLVLPGIGAENAGKISCRGVDDRSDPGCRRLDHADDLGPELVQRRHGGKSLHAIRVEHGRAHRAAENDELVIPLGEIGCDLGSRDRIFRIGNQGLSLEQILHAFGFRT